MPAYRRGEIVLLPIPYIQNYRKGKARPALIIQNNIANKFSNNLIVALISSSIPSKKYPMHYYIDLNKEKETGLSSNSIVKGEIIVTIPQKVVIKSVGLLSRKAMLSVNKCIRKSLAIEETNL